jgi:hypothetical protein
MPSTYLDDLIAEVFGIVVEVFGLAVPPTGSRNTFTQMQGMNHNFVTGINNGKYVLPLAVVQLGTFAYDEDWAFDRWGQDRLPVVVHYVSTLGSDTGTQAQVDAQARAFVSFIDDPVNLPFANFWPADMAGTVRSDLSNEINDALLAVSEVNVISASAVWFPGWMIDFTQFP